MNNSYELEIADRSIPGFYPLDAVKLVLNNLLTLAPFFIGMRFLSSDAGRALLIKCLATGAIFYSVPMLVEVRLSPQLHSLVYGFFPHSFAQQVRDGGFRPVVFLSHGLEVALFSSLAFVAAMVAVRGRWHLLRTPPGVISAYLGMVLLLCKTMGAIAYAAIAAPVVLITRPRTWIKIAFALLLIVCAYPLLRSHGLFPVQQIAKVANTISTDRGASFQYRVDNENKLLARANEKPFFGWGTWGRNRVYDVMSGDDVAVTDGAWILRYGMFGWAGYISLFGLFATAGFRALKSVREQVTPPAVALGGLALLLSLNVLDLLPNANLLPLTYLIAGSVAGCVPARSGRRTVQPGATVSSVASHRAATS